MLFEAIYAAQRVQKNILITGMNSKSQNINGKSKKKNNGRQELQKWQNWAGMNSKRKKVLITGLNSTDSKSLKNINGRDEL